MSHNFKLYFESDEELNAKKETLFDDDDDEDDEDYSKKRSTKFNVFYDSDDDDTLSKKITTKPTLNAKNIETCPKPFLVTTKGDETLSSSSNRYSNILINRNGNS